MKVAFLRRGLLTLGLASSLLFSSSLAMAQQSENRDSSRKRQVFFYGQGKRLGVIASRASKRDGSEEVGVRVGDVIRDSAADKAGIRSGDIITEIDGKAVNSAGSLMRNLQGLDYDKAFSIKVVRNGSPLQLTATLEKRDEEAFEFNFDSSKWREEAERAKKEAFKAREKAMRDLRGQNFGKANFFYFSNKGRLGVSTQDLNEQLGRYFGVEKGQGVLVSFVADNSPAAKAGIKAGDCVVAINGRSITDTGDLRNELRKVDSGNVTVTVIREKRRQDINVTLEPRPEPAEVFEQGFAPVDIVPLAELESLRDLEDMEGLEDLKDLKDLKKLEKLEKLKIAPLPKIDLPPMVFEFVEPLDFADEPVI